MPADPDPLWSKLLLQVLLILINALFAACEIAVISLNENKLRRQMELGDKKAGQLIHMLQKPARFLSTIQTCITLAGFLASAFAASNFSPRVALFITGTLGIPLPQAVAQTIALVLVTAVLSFFSLVFGELVPKRLAMVYSDKVARWTCGIITTLSIILKPIITLLSGSTNVILRLFRIDPTAESDQVTEEEIRLMVDIGEEKGAIDTNERDMIENVFEFNNNIASDVMTHRTDMSAIWIDDTSESILQTIEETGLSRFPVYDEDFDDIIGVLSTRTWLLNERLDEPKPLRELLRDAYFVPETVKTDILFRNMQKMKVHLAIVVDEYGGTSGLVTMEDLLEEIVGNIYDEFDPLDAQDICKIDENVWRVAGGVDLGTLSEEIGIELPIDEEYSTLGGLVFSCLSAIPDDGTTPVIESHGLRVCVEKIEDKRVVTAKVEKIVKEDVKGEGE